jgi:hypothetical protein
MGSKPKPSLQRAFEVAHDYRAFERELLAFLLVEPPIPISREATLLIIGILMGHVRERMPRPPLIEPGGD